MTCDFADYSGGRTYPKCCRRPGRPAMHGHLERCLCDEHFEALRAATPDWTVSWVEKREEEAER